MMMRMGFGIGVVALALGACGGTVDMQTDPNAAGTGGRSGGSGGRAPVTAGNGAVMLPGVGGQAPGYTGTPGDDDPVIGGGGTPHAALLAYDADPAAFGRSIYVTSVDNPACHQRVTSPAAQAKQPAFSPDGTLLAYASRSSGIYQIHTLDLASGEVEVLTDLPSGATYPAFSPDGALLTFVSGDPETFPGGTMSATGDVMLLDLETRDVRKLRASEDGGCCNLHYQTPAFAGSDEVLTGNRVSLIGVSLKDASVRDVVPITGRIPNPQDPAPSPDGLRYAFSDFCGGAGLQLFVARLDGSTGDTCDAALHVAPDRGLVSAEWGPSGYIAAEILADPHGIVLADDESFMMTDLPTVRGARNPTWAPESLELAIACE
jgi:hypothetical protein